MKEVIWEFFKEWIQDQITFLIVFTTLLLTYIVKKSFGKRYNLPPGPRGLPIIGYLPFLGDRPHKKLMLLRKKYGGLVWLGARLVVLNDVTTIKDAFSRNEFSGRPEGFFKFHDLYENVVNMRGKQWAEHTRFNNTILRDLGMGKEEIEEVILEQMNRIVLKLNDLKDGDEIALQPLLALAVDNVILFMICGKTYNEGDAAADMLHQFQIQSLRYLSSISLAMYFPSLKPLFLKLHPSLKDMRPAIGKLETYLKKEVQEHEHNLDPDHPNDFMDHFLNEIEKRKNSNGFTRHVLNGTSQFFLLAGSETGRVLLEWALLLLAKHQEVQEKAFQEIQTIIGTEKPISWKDRDSLPYNYALLLEILRRKTLTPVGVSRCALTDTKIGPYDIPKGTVVLANLWGVHMDPDIFPEPKKFMPERFLGDDGTIRNIDCLLPFSYGPRRCPGEKMAMMQNFVSLATLIQKFQFMPPNKRLSCEKTFSLTFSPVNSTVKIKKR